MGKDWLIDRADKAQHTLHCRKFWGKNGGRKMSEVGDLSARKKRGQAHTKVCVCVEVHMRL